MRRHIFPRPRRRSKGATLISLMVGLTLSMLLVAAMMLVFRNLSRTTGDAVRDAQADDNLVAGLLSAGLTLHEAGFNIPNARLGSALIVVKQAVLNNGKLTGTLSDAASAYTGNLVIWQQKLGPKIQCSGLLAPSGGGLKRLLGPLDCSDINAWASQDWTDEVIARTPEALDGVSPAPLTIIAREGSKICAPFGISAPNSHLLVTVRALNSNSNTFQAVECLGNFIDPTPASS